MDYKTCEVCEGDGYLVRGLVCPRCYGDGMTLRTECDGCGGKPTVLVDAHGNVLCERCGDAFCCELCEAKKRSERETDPELPATHDTIPCPPPDMEEELEQSLALLRDARAVGYDSRRALRIGRAAR